MSGADNIPSKAERIQFLLGQGWSYSRIAAEVQCSKGTIHYHARKQGNVREGRRYDWNVVQSYHDAGHNRTECTRHFGFSADAWDEAVTRGALVPRDHLIPLHQLLTRGRNTSRAHLKRRLQQAGLLEDKCYRCGITSWLDEPLTFEVHHINGDGNDNRLENLTLLCPNCHSQTPNYCGKNTRRARGEHP